MKLTDLIRRFRTEANDKAQPYFWSDLEVTDWLNDAEDEAALRARLIYEQVDADVCEVSIESGEASYELHPSLYELSNMHFKILGDSRRYPVVMKSPEELDRIQPDWRERVGLGSNGWCGGLYLMQSDKGIRLAPVPDQDGTLFIEGYRLPLDPMKLADKETVEPEINKAHHRHLIQWALHKAFSIPDTEAFDATRAAIAEEEFTRYFGIRPDADLRRSTRDDETQTVKAFWV